ncbi:MAG TPA: LytTR family DNA-binding domain-containing protein [Verrucomicrobiae bacterium]|jgi:two-component system LytT family response regulator|nr:LytTR family DNA-binding domain-containing protein [Verrucomicrobiae bacterium]
MKIRTILADDEQLGRERLRQLLSGEPEIEVVAECADGQEAAAAIEKHSPDLVFLDIQMPELDGFQVLESMPAEEAPVIVFVTAHDKFALRAFEVHAVDYLLKPFDRDRFKKALARAMDRVKQRGKTEPMGAQQAVLAHLRPPQKPLERLAVKTGGRVIFVKLTDIDYIEAAHNYVELHVDKQSHLLRETLNSIEARLPEDKFVRISRSVIVNIDRIKELQPMFYGEYTVTLHNGARLTLSRRFRDKLARLGLG